MWGCQGLKAATRQWLGANICAACDGEAAVPGDSGCRYSCTGLPTARGNYTDAWMSLSSAHSRPDLTWLLPTNTPFAYAAQLLPH